MIPFSSKIQALGDAKYPWPWVLSYPRRCGAARMMLDRRGDVGGVSYIAGCSNDKLSGAGLSLVSDIGVCSLTGEKTG